MIMLEMLPTEPEFYPIDDRRGQLHKARMPVMPTTSFKPTKTIL
jgi:hypothetical protein